MKREFSAGGAVYKKTGDTVLWLIIKPTPSVDFPKNRYQLPKGHVEPGERVIDAALREVLEETGIKATIIKKILDSKYVFPFRGEKIFKVVTFFLMEYVSGEPTVNDEAEEILWLSYVEAYKQLTYSSDKQVLKKASEMFASSTGG